MLAFFSFSTYDALDICLSFIATNNKTLEYQHFTKIIVNPPQLNTASAESESEDCKNFMAWWVLWTSLVHIVVHFSPVQLTQEKKTDKIKKWRKHHHKQLFP